MPSRRPHSEHRVAFTIEPVGEPLVIDNPATVKVVYDPVRFRIISALGAPMSVKELAEALETTPNRLYYHVRTLERHGIIKVAEERRVGSNIENAYLRAADHFVLSGELARVTPPPHLPQALQDALGRFSRTLDAVGRGKFKGQFSSAMNEAMGRFSLEQVEELTRRLEKLVREFFKQSKGDEDEDHVEYGLLYVLAPFPVEDKTLDATRPKPKRAGRKGPKR